MATEDQILPLSFQHGLDTKTAEKQTASGSLLDLQNGIFSNPNSITKRWGYDNLSSLTVGSATINTCAAIQAFENELLLFDNFNSYAYSQALNRWITKSQFTSVITTNEIIVRNNQQQIGADCAALNNITVFAWKDTTSGSSLRYSVLDQTTNTYIVNNSILETDSTAKYVKTIAFAAANYIIIAYTIGSNQATSKLVLRKVDLASPYSASQPALIVNIASGKMYFDGSHLHPLFDVVTTSTKLYIIYYGGTTNNGITVTGLDATYITSGGISGSAVTNEIFLNGLTANSVDYCSPNIITDVDGYVWSTWVDGYKSLYSARLEPVALLLDVQIKVDTSPSTQQQSINKITTAEFAFDNPGSRVIQYFYEITAANNWQHSIQFLSYTYGHSVGASSTFRLGVGLASKAFTVASQGRIYLNVVYPGPLADTYFTLDGTTGIAVSKMLPGIGAGILANTVNLPQCTLVSTTPDLFQFANAIQGNLFSTNGQLSTFIGINNTTLDFHHNNEFLSASINNGLYTVGGILQSYDNNDFFEHGFNYYPENIAITFSGSGGSVANGTFQYIVCYAWIDNNGFTQWSTPSVAQSFTVSAGGGGGNSTVFLTVPNLRLTKKSNVQIVIFRTTAGGSLFYQVSDPTNPTYSSTTSDDSVITDTLSDAALQSNALLYTQPNTVGSNPVLDNSAPPACSIITTYADRLFVSGTDDQNQIWYTKAKTINVPMEFSDQLTLSCDPDGGPITALKTMDDKLIIFKRTSIFYISGQGPTATGDGNDLNNIIKIPSDVGCIEPNSVVEIPTGLIFKSLKGMYLLSRGEQVSYIGAQVEKYNNLSITSGTVISPQWVIYTTATTTLVYDYLVGEWGTFTNHNNAIDSDIFVGNNNLFVWADSNGVVHQQNLTSFLDDNSTQYNVSLTTAWLSLNNLQGYQRVKKIFIIGQYYGNSTSDVITVNIGYDFNDTFSTSSTINLGTLTSNTPGPFQFRVDLQQQKCQSIRIQVVDTQSVSNATTFSIDAITLKVGMKPGATKVPAAKQFSNS